MSILYKLKNGQNFTLTEQSLVTYILVHQESVARMDITELAQKAHSSDTSILHLCHKLGIDSYKEFRVQLIKELERQLKGHRKIEPFRETITLDRDASVMREIGDLIQESIDHCQTSISMENLEIFAQTLAEAQTIYVYAFGDCLVTSMSFMHRMKKLQKLMIVGTEFGDVGRHILNMQKEDIALFISDSGHLVLNEKQLEAVKKRGSYMMAMMPKPSSGLFDQYIRLPRKENVQDKQAIIYNQTCLHYIFACLYKLIHDNLH